MTAVTGFQEAISIREDSIKRTPMQPGSFRKKKFRQIYKTVFQSVAVPEIGFRGGAIFFFFGGGGFLFAQILRRK